VPFDAKNVSVIIPASSHRVVSIVGKPLRAGNLVIRGCVVQALGGTSREFILPLSTDDEEARLSRRRSALECEAGRSKYCGLDSRPWKRGGKRVSASVSSNMKPSRFLECKVVPEQPLLRIRRTSLTHGAVMMYNGEMLVLIYF
jgi:trafficking protein particle complex subunit 9